MNDDTCNVVKTDKFCKRFKTIRPVIAGVYNSSGGSKNVPSPLSA